MREVTDRERGSRPARVRSATAAPRAAAAESGVGSKTRRKASLRHGSGRADAAIRLIRALYAPAEGASGQARALAILSNAQRNGRGKSPSALFNFSRDLFSRNAIFAQRLYRGLRKQGLTLELPELDQLQRLPSLRAVLEARWGADYMDPGATVRSLWNQDYPNIDKALLTQWIVASTGADERAWRNRNAFGLVAEAYLADLTLLHKALVRAERVEEAVALRTAMLAIVDDRASDRLSALSRERGLLICGTHAGPFRFGYRRLWELFPDMHAVAAKEGRELTAADPVRMLFTLSKALRKAGTVALIGADGPEGESIGQAQVHDLAIPVRLGAPALIHNARCANVFFLSRWTQDGLLFECRDGPEPAKGETVADWSVRWLAAYAAVMTDLVNGDAANVQGAFGMWGLISGAVKARKPDDGAAE
jgi:hypothetical protein